eukprot:Skav203529  [mRNA]  locus=scaffold687:402569:411520:- [translate_table: standard]
MAKLRCSLTAPYQDPCGYRNAQAHHYEPAANDVPASEQNMQTLRSALEFAHRRIREQEAEIQQLRRAFAHGSRMNEYLIAEIEQAKAQLMRFEAQAARQDDVQSFQSLAPPLPSSIPIPFHAGAPWARVITDIHKQLIHNWVLRKLQPWQFIQTGSEFDMCDMWRSTQQAGTLLAFDLHGSVCERQLAQNLQSV